MFPASLSELLHVAWWIAVCMSTGRRWYILVSDQGCQIIDGEFED